jgi:hypothetical protein
MNFVQLRNHSRDLWTPWEVSLSLRLWKSKNWMIETFFSLFHPLMKTFFCVQNYFTTFSSSLKCSKRIFEFDLFEFLMILSIVVTFGSWRSLSSFKIFDSIGRAAVCAREGTFFSELLKNTSLIFAQWSRKEHKIRFSPSKIDYFYFSISFCAWKEISNEW